MTLLERIKARSVTWLVRVACYLALAALAVMAFSILNPRPVPVIFAMSVGHVVGGLAFGCYFASVLLDTTKASRENARKIRASDSDETGSAGSRRE